MKSVKQIIKEVDLFDADLAQTALGKKKRKDMVIIKVSDNKSMDKEFEEMAMSAMNEIGLPEDEAERMLEDYLI